MKCISVTKQVIALFAIGIFHVSSFAQSTVPASAPAESKIDKPQLIFQTGFGGTSAVKPKAKANLALVKSDYPTDYIVGKDTDLPEKSDWKADLDDNPAAGNFFLEYTGGEPRQRYARVVPEPGNPKNKVLKFWLGDYWNASEGQQKARIQTSLYGIRDGYKEFYHTQRVYLHPDFKAVESFPDKITWLTLGEYWNNEWWVPNEKYGFRITFGVGKARAEDRKLRFHLEGEDAGQIEVWRTHNNDVEVPIGKWFTMETYFKEGNKDTGRFYIAITPEGGKRVVLFDIHNYTHSTYDKAPTGMTGFNPQKLYTSKQIVSHVKAQGKALQVYWDDFKLWTNKRPD
jgi:hypothetical protein